MTRERLRVIPRTRGDDAVLFLLDRQVHQCVEGAAFFKGAGGVHVLELVTISCRGRVRGGPLAWVCAGAGRGDGGRRRKCQRT